MISGTIAVCTRNRAGILEQSLASLDTQIAEPNQLEVLVVDNGSTDATPKILREWQRRRGHRRVLVEPRVGLVNARNAALQASDHDVVLFVDDDALVPPVWARAHLAVYDGDDHAGSVGGPVGLFWPAARPDWMTDELTQWFSALDLGDDTCEFPTTHGPYGTNMSVRRTAAIEAGGYEPWLGRSGRRLLSGEEADLTRRLKAAGWNIVYCPAAAVIQQVLPERLERRWLLRRAWAQGVSNARLEILADRPTGRNCFRRSGAELADSAHRWWRRRRGVGGEEELASLLRVLAHAGAGTEFVRFAVSRSAPWAIGSVPGGDPEDPPLRVGRASGTS